MTERGREERGRPPDFVRVPCSFSFPPCFRYQRTLQTDGEPASELAALGSTRLSLFLMMFVGFLTNLVSSIVIPSLPKFLVEVGSPAYLNGWVSASLSLGSILFSPAIGYWADRRGVKEV